jgi:hypothetical protein
MTANSNINEKHIERLHEDGLLSSFDFESFNTCESYLLGKMTKTPFTGQSERVSDLLVLVHTDLFEPMISVTNNGFSISLLLHMTLVDMDTLT